MKTKQDSFSFRNGSVCFCWVPKLTGISPDICNKLMFGPKKPWHRTSSRLCEVISCYISYNSWLGRVIPAHWQLKVAKHERWCDLGNSLRRNKRKRTHLIITSDIMDPTVCTVSHRAQNLDFSKLSKLSKAPSLRESRSTWCADILVLNHVTLRTTMKSLLLVNGLLTHLNKHHRRSFIGQIKTASLQVMTQKYFVRGAFILNRFVSSIAA